MRRSRHDRGEAELAGVHARRPGVRPAAGVPDDDAIQPIIWLLLFGALFKSVTHIPGFHGGSYIDFLTPGVVVMLAVFSAGWIGMGFIEDIHTGVMDRMLTSPVWRGSLNVGTVACAAATVVIQSVLIVLLALALGADYKGGVGGVVLLIAIAALLGSSFASLSNGVAMLARQRETLIGAVTFVQLPLTFLSAALMQQSLVPGWIETVASSIRSTGRWRPRAARRCRKSTGAWWPPGWACWRRWRWCAPGSRRGRSTSTRGRCRAGGGG